MDELGARVDSSNKARVKDVSRNQYANSQVRFVQWLSANAPQVVNPRWVALVVAAAKKKAKNSVLDDRFKPSMKSKLVDFDAQIPPLLMIQLTADLFLKWVHSLGTGYDSLNSHRSAIKGLFKDYGCQLPAEWDDKVGKAFQGLKRKEAEKKASGGVVVRAGKGKIPVQFSFLVALCTVFYELGENFGHLYAILCWNLMSRSKNVTFIHFAHLGWKDDALTILFCVTKTDQTGDRMFDRHVYANPLQPAICPILSLGLFLMIYEFSENTTLLFAGGKQYNHFSTVFKGAIKNNKDRFANWVSGDDDGRKDFGTHSFRKGAATYVCSGSTVGPHISPVSIRCGWKQPGVQDTYLKYAAAGDQYVGRVAAGLPLDSANFAILPPFFEDTNHPAVVRGLELAFGHLKGHVSRFVLVHLLASIIYHYKFIVDTFKKGSRALNATIFMDNILLCQLQSLVKCYVSGDSNTGMKATGLPPHVVQMGGMERLGARLDGFREHVSVVGDGVATKVLTGLDERQIESHVTPTSMKTQITEAFHALGIREMVESFRAAGGSVAGGSVAAGAALVAAAANPVVQTYYWGGKFGRQLPEGYTLVTSGPKVMWSLYIAGNPSQGIPPLRQVNASDCSSKNVRKRFW